MLDLEALKNELISLSATLQTASELLAEKNQKCLQLAHEIVAMQVLGNTGDNLYDRQ